MEIRPLAAGELEQAWELDRDAFHSPAANRERFLRWPPERLVGAFAGERLVAQCGALGFAQHFGGRSVPMGGLSSVAVAPDQRGQGLAGRVVGACLEAMRERGEVISTLFPATTRVYRRMGFEVAGNVTWRRIAPRLLEGLPPGDGVCVRPADADDRDAIRACYDDVARSVNGFLDRPGVLWKARREEWSERSVFAAEDAEGRIAGYLIYRQADGPTSSLGGPWQIVVEEVVWGSRAAGLALWRLLGSWAAQVDRILYRTGAEDPLLLLLPEQVVETIGEVRWMTRLVDPCGAVEARGYPEGIDLEVPFELVDDALPANDGPYVLHVRKGRGSLERGGPGGARFDIGAFSSLYTGWATTSVLARAGRVEGGTRSERGALDAAFAGPTPWMLDEF